MKSSRRDGPRGPAFNVFWLSLIAVPWFVVRVSPRLDSLSRHKSVCLAFWPKADISEAGGNSRLSSFLLLTAPRSLAGALAGRFAVASEWFRDFEDFGLADFFIGGILSAEL